MEEQKIEVRFNLSGPRRTSGSRVRKWPCVEVNKDFIPLISVPPLQPPSPQRTFQCYSRKIADISPMERERQREGGRERETFLS